MKIAEIVKKLILKEVEIRYWQVDEDEFEKFNYDFYNSGYYHYCKNLIEECGGKLVYSSNDNNSYYSYAPTLIYKFSDGSKIKLFYSGISLLFSNKEIPILL